ncbi:Hypothetical_protein [Hexamita inflata]|uniref:Hypothetical_protein n=1 Tax=Hexamita inflata TaxID=28002 RepID=A0AA86QJ96_9EUKA|nr:Hypothetical protein HINF_LOCUS42292 [Hexamita inflata]
MLHQKKCGNSILCLHGVNILNRVIRQQVKMERLPQFLTTFTRVKSGSERVGKSSQQVGFMMFDTFKTKESNLQQQGLWYGLQQQAGYIRFQEHSYASSQQYHLESDKQR